jgi:hypothetical protein
MQDVTNHWFMKVIAHYGGLGQWLQKEASRDLS